MACTTSRLVSRNIGTAGGRSSMRQEPELWDAINDICRQENWTVDHLVQEARARYRGGGRTSAVRVFIVQYYREKLKRQHAASSRLRLHAISDLASQDQPQP